MKKVIIWCSSIFLLLVLLAVAVSFLLWNREEEEGYRLYYLSEEEDMLLTESYTAEETETNALAAELYLQQQSLPEHGKEEEKLLLPKSVSLLNYTVEDGLIRLNFSSGYQEMSPEREILVRAGMVRLFTQIPGITRVQFLVEEKVLKNAEGMDVGVMTASRFVENSGKEINSYQKTVMSLYFASPEGGQLVREERNVYYNSNVPVERVVVEQLIKGPGEAGHQAALPPELNILSVTIQEKICYVNLDNSFLNQLEASGSTLDPELAVYSIVNSLADTCQVNKIQISVNGKTNIRVGEVDLSGILSRREDLIREEEPAEETEEKEDA